MHHARFNVLLLCAGGVQVALKALELNAMDAQDGTVDLSPEGVQSRRQSAADTSTEADRRYLIFSCPKVEEEGRGQER